MERASPSATLRTDLLTANKPAPAHMQRAGRSVAWFVACTTGLALGAASDVQSRPGPCSHVYRSDSCCSAPSAGSRPNPRYSEQTATYSHSVGRDRVTPTAPPRRERQPNRGDAYTRMDEDQASAGSQSAPTALLHPSRSSGLEPCACSSSAAGVSGATGWRLFAAVNSPRLRFPVAVSLSGGHLLVGRWFASGVSDSA